MVKQQVHEKKKKKPNNNMNKQTKQTQHNKQTNKKNIIIIPLPHLRRNLVLFVSDFHILFDLYIQSQENNNTA